MLVDPGDVARRDRDRALIEAHCAGDETAFPVIVREHYRALLAQAHRRLGSPVEAEDAVQETFERAYRALCRLNGEYRIGAWLHRILANVCVDHALRRQRQRVLPERIGRRQTNAPDASEQASDPVVVRAVQAALAALPASQRQTFWLYEVDGLSYPEVARQLGITEDNARARVHRARSALRRTLARARDAVAAILTIPVGLRVLSRHGRKLPSASRANPAGSTLGRGGDLVQGASSAASGLHAGVAQVAYAVNAGPLADLATSGASGGPSALVVMVASVATAVGGALAVPAVTGSSGPSNDAASAAVTSAPGMPDPAAVSQLSATAPVTLAVGGTTGTGSAPSTVTTGPTRLAVADWITAGAEATGDLWEAPDATTGSTPATAPAVDPCPWLASYPDVMASLPGRAPVIGTTDPAAGSVDPGLSMTLSTATTLRLFDEPDGPATATIPVVIQAQVCLAPGEAAIVADVRGDDGARVQLRGPAVMKLNDGYFLFRGSVSRPVGAPGLSLPWGLGGRFVAQFELDAATRIATLDVAFLDAPRPTPTSTPATTPTTGPDRPPSTSTTVAAPAGGGTPPTTPTTEPTTPTTEPTTPTTEPTPAPSPGPSGGGGSSSAGDGASSSGSSP